jgi:hypothetical protein
MTCVVQRGCALDALLPPSGLCSTQAVMVEADDVPTAQPTTSLAGVSPRQLLEELLLRCQDFHRDAWLVQGSKQASALVDGVYHCLAQRPWLRHWQRDTMHLSVHEQSCCMQVRCVRHAVASLSQR